MVMIWFDGCCRSKRHYSDYSMAMAFFEFSTMVRWSLQAPTRCWWRRTGYAGTRSGSCSEGLSQNVQNPSESHGLICLTSVHHILPKNIVMFGYVWVKLWLKRKWPDIDFSMTLMVFIENICISTTRCSRFSIIVLSNTNVLNNSIL